MKSKPELRLIAKDIRKTLEICKISENIVSNIRDLNLYKSSQNIMLFHPTKYEINLLSLLEDDKNFFLPKVDGENIMVCPYKNGDNLKKSEFNILEPCTESVNAEVLDLVIVPALMVDNEGFRLGYGGGYYDRFLIKFKENFKTIVVIPKDLIVELLPRDAFDMPIDIIVSER